MAVLKQEQLLANIKKILGDNTSDEALALIEDVTDTTNDYENKSKDSTDWKKKYEDNDQEWRKKYRDRFFSGGDDNPKDEKDTVSNDDKGADETDPENKPMTYENLFKEETK